MTTGNVNQGNAQFQAFLRKQEQQQPQAAANPTTNQTDEFIASVTGADQQQACGYGGRGGGGCR